MSVRPSVLFVLNLQTNKWKILLDKYNTIAGYLTLTRLEGAHSAHWKANFWYWIMFCLLQILGYSGSSLQEALGEVCSQWESASRVPRDTGFSGQASQVTRCTLCPQSNIVIVRYDHQERLTAMEAMEHAYFFPVVKDHGRMSNISSGSPTGAGGGAGNMSGGVPASPIMSPINTPLPPNMKTD